MEKVNIFSDENKVSGNWIKFTEVGQEFQGTLVDIRKTTDQYGKEQIIYEFLTEDGEYRPFGSKSAIDAQMKHVKLGQIVGLKFVSETPAKTAGFKPTKIIQVFTNKNLVNKEWLEQRESYILENSDGQSMESIAASLPDQQIHTDVTGGNSGWVKPQDGNTDPLSKINELAKTKLLVFDVELVKKAVQEVTGLAFIEQNYDKLIGALSSMPDKK